MARVALRCGLGLCLSALALAAVPPRRSVPEFRDVEATVQRLLADMTLEEKARQLVIQDGPSTFFGNGDLNASAAADFLGHLGAGVVDSMGRNVDPALSNAVQRAIINSSRHGIGAIFAEECQHGVQGDWHTIFPSPYTLAAAFDRDLMRQIGAVIAAEARAGGAAECWSPVCGVAREPRWGRSEEEMSEDPFLAGELAEAMVAGMVGTGDLSAPDTVAPLLKHYAAYSVPEAGRNAAPAHMGLRELRTVFLPVFGKAIRAGAQGIMSSYNEIDGVPTSSDPWLLTEQLRGELGFDGYVASDFGAISRLGPGTHAVAANDSDCVRQYVVAGGSVNGHDFGSNYELLVAQLVRQGRMSEAALDKAVGNVLRVKARLGLVPDAGANSTYRPYTDETLVQTRLGDNSTHQRLAVRAANQGVVLLSNANKTLPFHPSDYHHVLLVGPNADEVRAGDYSAAGWAGGAPNGGGNIDNLNSVTILEGLAKAYDDVTLSIGTAINGDDGAPGFAVVQRHSLSVSAAFQPNAPSSPYKPVTPAPALVAKGAPGLTARYYAGTQLAGAPVLVRQDMAPNFHWFGLGPHPTLFRNATFSVSWEGVLTPAATVEGALFNALLCHGQQCGLGKGRGSGARLYLDGHPVLNAWDDDGSGSTQSSPVTLAKGRPVALRFEYWQASSAGTPSIALQWSLLPSTVANPGYARSIANATALVAGADAVVLALGGANNDGASTTEGEGVDRASLALPGMQLALLEAVWAECQRLGRPMVVVLVDGKPTAEPRLLDLPAVLAALQGGQAQGVAVANVLSGALNPTGKLPVSFPASADVLPVYYNHKPSALRSGWCDTATATLWPFGHGLSYTTFAYSHLTAPAGPVAPSATVTISAVVTNTGAVPGEEVAQLYLRDDVASVTTPVRTLKGFARTGVLAPGASATVAFAVDVAHELRVLSRAGVWVVEPGTFSIEVGGTSARPGLLTGHFSVAAS